MVTYYFSGVSAPTSTNPEARELQLDYWMSAATGLLSLDEKDRERKRSDISKPKDAPSTKTSLKAAFKFLYVTRPSAQANVFTLSYAMKEKKIQSQLISGNFRYM